MKPSSSFPPIFWVAHTKSKKHFSFLDTHTHTPTKTTVVLLMEEILHQLRLVVSPITYELLTSQVVVWDFFHHVSKVRSLPVGRSAPMASKKLLKLRRGGPAGPGVATASFEVEKRGERCGTGAGTEP